METQNIKQFGENRDVRAKAFREKETQKICKYNSCKISIEDIRNMILKKKKE